MAFISPFIMANKNGIPRLESTGVTVGATNVRFSFRNHPFLSAPFSGLILFRLAQPIPSGTTGTLPVVFDTNGATQYEQHECSVIYMLNILFYFL